MTSAKERFPKRSKYGDSTPVCEWCGKRVNYARMWRQYGTYCSLECQAASRPSYYHSLLIFAIIGTIVPLGVLILGNYGTLALPVDIIIPMVMILLCSLCCIFYAGHMTNLGSKVIKSQEEPMDKDELEKICTAIMDIVQTNQTLEGVTRKILYDTLRTCGYKNRYIKSGIEHLLVSERLRQVDLTHYASV